tara:strand:- start:298 stop:1884 length:1587 start_codon:yes stop_codon:yes gene_type:complete
MAKRVQTDDVKGYGSFRSSAVASTIDAFSGAPQIDKNDGLGQLAKSLGIASQSAAKKGVDDEKKKQLIFQSKKELYAAEIKKDIKFGNVNAVKIGEKYPEFSQTTSMAISEFMGSNKGVKDTRSFIENLKINDPDIFLDKKRLQDSIDDERTRLLSDNEGSEFYSSGVLQGFSSVINQNTSQWDATRAKFHNDEAKEYFSEKVYSNLQINGKGAWEKIESLDKLNKKVSPLNNIQMKDVVIDSTIEYAMNTKDIEILKSIPRKYWKGTTASKLADVTNKIQKLKLQDYNTNKMMQTYQRAETLRNDKNSIMKDHLDGKQTQVPYKINGEMNPNYNELVGYQLSIKEASLIPLSQSKAYSQNLEAQIIVGASDGGEMSLISGITSNDANEKDIITLIQNNNQIHPTHKVELIDLVPKLFEGANLVYSEPATDNYKMGLSAELDSFLKSAFGETDKALGLRTGASVKTRYYSSIKQQVKTYITTNKKVPSGEEFTLIYEKAEVLARKLMDQKIKEAGGFITPTPISIPNN